MSVNNQYDHYYEYSIESYKAVEGLGTILITKITASYWLRHGLVIEKSNLQQYYQQNTQFVVKVCVFWKGH